MPAIHASMAASAVVATSREWIGTDMPYFADRGADEHFLATANVEGQSISSIWRPARFLRVLDDKAIGFADFARNGNTSRRAISPTVPKRISS
jgi:predicted pyridoxine 5'-phosphate oxidase superfamily flavin-nucleotide-binding protein